MKANFLKAADYGYHYNLFHILNVFSFGGSYQD